MTLRPPTEAIRARNPCVRARRGFWGWEGGFIRGARGAKGAPPGHRLQIAGAPDDGIALWRPEMADKTRFYGQLALGFAFDPFRKENLVEDPNRRFAINSTPVKAQLITYVDAGVELLHRFAFQVEMPV